LRKAGYKGEEKIDWLFTFSVAAYNMVRMRNLGGNCLWIRGEITSERLEAPQKIKKGNAP
jgi:hypothetical protein